MSVESRLTALENRLSDNVSPNDLPTSASVPTGGSVVAIDPILDEFVRIPESFFDNGGEGYNQSYLNAGITLIAATSGTDYICRPTTPITVLIDATELATKHRNYFDNPSDQDITFASASDTVTDPDYVDIVASNGLVLAAGGTAYLYREFDTNIVHLKIS